jgi:hypothetical protein
MVVREEDETEFFQESDPVEHTIEIAPKETNESMITLNIVLVVSIVGILVAWILFRRSRQGPQRYTAPDAVGFPHIFPSHLIC